MVPNPVFLSPIALSGVSMNKTEQLGDLEFRSSRNAGTDAGTFAGVDPTADDDSEIDFRAIALMLWRGKWIILLCTLIAGIIGYVVISQIEPRYTSSAKVMVNLSESNVVDLDDVVVRSASQNMVGNEIEVLSSTKLIERVIEKLALDEDPEFNPSLRPPSDTLVSRVRSWFWWPQAIGDFLRGLGILSPSPPPVDQEQQVNPEQIAEWERLAIINSVLGGLSLVPIEGSRVIEISYVSRSPTKAAAIANAIAEEYIVDQLDAKLEATRAATNWIAGRIEEMRVRVEEAEKAVEAARARLSEEAGQGLDITQQQLTALNASLSAARQQTTAAKATYDRLSAALADGTDVGAVPEFRSSELIQSYREEEVRIIQERASLEKNPAVPDDHPFFEKIKEQLEDVRKKIREEAVRIVEAARLNWVSKQAEEKTIETDVRALETRSLEQSREQVEIRQLEREAEASRALYENFLTRLQQTSEQETLQAADARILSPAERPLGPIEEGKRITLAVSLILGALVGMAIVYLLDRLNNTFRSAGQIEDLTGLPVIGTIPTLGRRIKRQKVLQYFREKPKSSLAEDVRSLRTSILMSNVDKPPKVVMLTSSVPREGKSTTAMLLAITSRQMGKSAIIVDCDLRLPSLSGIMEAEDDQPGLLSVLYGTAKLSDAIYRDDESKLHVLMTKKSEPRFNINAADILSSHRFDQLIENLKERYDRVILDTPPTLVVADARILSSLADTVVYAVEWDRTPRGAVLEGLKELRAVNAPIAGIALTMVDEARASKYAYDGYAYYKGRYKDYYVS